MLLGGLCHAQNPEEWQITETGVQFRIDQLGQGLAKASINDTATIRFVGRLQDTGKIFAQTSKNKNQTFKIGHSNMIPGIQLGILGMKVGEHRTLKVPAKLGFGTKAAPKVPANSNLVITLELLKLSPPLQTKKIKPGQGPSIKTGDIAVVHYVGKLANQTIFDSSRKRNLPFEFGIGSPRVIAGWSQGVSGMKAGEIRTLIIPPHLGYGSKGKGKIPPNSTLYFEIELLKIKPGVTWKTLSPDPSANSHSEKKIQKKQTLKNGGAGKIHVQIYTLNGQTVTNTQFAKPLTITLNAKVDPIGLAIGVIGMKKNEVRRIHIPPMFGLQKNGPFRNKHLIATVDLVEIIR